MAWPGPTISSHQPGEGSSAEERAWWRLAGFRIVGQTESFRLYEAVRN